MQKSGISLTSLISRATMKPPPRKTRSRIPAIIVNDDTEDEERGAGPSASRFSSRRSRNMKHIKEEPPSNAEQAIDLKSAVKELHGLSSQEINKLLRDSENFIINLYTERGSLVQIDMERVAPSLPLHLIAVLISSNKDVACLKYMLCGIRLLHSLCDLAPRHSRLEQILLDDFKVIEQLMDLVFYMFIILGSFGQGNHDTRFVPLLHSALVASSLYLLTGFLSSQWTELVNCLLEHPKVDMFMDAAFDSVRVDIRFLSIYLSNTNANLLTEKSSSPADLQAVHNLCQQCEASLQFLLSLCQQKSFRERLLKHKELCRNGGVLLLVQAILKLDVIPFFNECPTVVAAVSRLKSKVLSIMLLLCETESFSYLDEVARSPRSMQLAKSVALEVLELMKAEFRMEVKMLNGCFDKTYPRGVMLLNSMRLADIFSDDSNFRSFVTDNFTQVLSEICSLPHGQFLSSWCSTDLTVKEEDASLEYDPFAAAGVILVSLFHGAGTSIIKSDQPNNTNTESSFTLNNIPQASYAQLRTSLLIKIIANLHCFVPDICEEQERNLFFNKFLACLQMELPKSSSAFLFTSDSQKAATVCQNLGSLLDHAVSLIPKFLNEDDLQLLSIFLKQLQSLMTPAQFETDNVQEPVQQNKIEDSMLLDKFKHGISEYYQEARSIKAFTSPPTRKVGPKAREIAPDLNNRNGNLKEGTSENSAFQEVEKFKVASNSMDIADNDMELNRKKSKGVINRSISGSLRDTDMEIQNVETSGSDSSSTRGKNSIDQMLDHSEFPKMPDNAKESRSRGLVQETEKIEIIQCDEKQRRRRKRNIMNEKQITIIERALLDEPEMQRNAALLQSWADKLSVHGSELTSSQLKNWLNNRKARLARAARDVRAPSEGENAFSDKPSGAGPVQFCDSPESPSEDYYVPPTGGSNQNTVKYDGITLRTRSSELSEPAKTDFADFATRQNMQMSCQSVRYARYEPGQCASLIDGEGKEVAKGKVYQVQGRWHGKNLEEDGTCIVDIHELKVERWSRLQHPSEAAGTTFDEAELKNGVMRVAWDANKIIMLPQ